MYSNPTHQLLMTSLLRATNTYASASADDGAGEVAATAAEGENSSSSIYNHYAVAALMSIIAWNVMVITLEVNDFRHRLMVAYDNSPSSDSNSNRYIASLVAIRYGLRDALVDWTLMYLIGYSIMAGITWTDAEPESLLVIWGFGVMISAALIAVSAIKIPQWLGMYHRSKLSILKDTSNLAPQAAHDLTTEGSSLKTFRYQVRLGVGKHFSQFVYVLLPFYVDLKIWAWLLSVVIGSAFGHAFLFVVFKCHRRFKKHRGRVAIGASFFLSIVSALLFTRGMFVVQEGWQRDIGNPQVLYPVSFFVWLAVCGLWQGLKYYEYNRLSTENTEEQEAQLFGTLENEPETVMVDDGLETTASELEEPLLDTSNNRRDVMRNESLAGQELSYFYYHSAYFKRVKFRGDGAASSITNSMSENSTPKEIYKTFTALEESYDVKWYQRIWQFLPFQPAWKLFVMGTYDTFICCRKDSEFNTKPLGHKAWFVVFKVLKICINCLALYVAIVACGATIQRKVTSSKLPYSFEHTYARMNEGSVCGFDKKCGDIRTFESKDLAIINNFTIAHCGPCGECSNWNDFPLQQTDLATPARTCGQKNIFRQGNNFLTHTQDCIQRDIGFTSGCAWPWAQSVDCSKKHCAFIYLQSQMTNQVGNFHVGPNTITSATCSEASCEAGNPGSFVYAVGANRRRMNIESEIARPAMEQCGLVGLPNNSIPKNIRGYNDWASFMSPKC
mmetsp:Transcript_12309/g.26743  ORF Transcript_12309/g.26743 Transcript_12309/m.26743 type:complete len:728 (+) Transcript_12309:260-2443(+)|eukprot:CAMPEP_0172309432 /NCGR_PEP_ID=MMETSP1058-20130122/9722_1 /TAXON_ID=83371 /ORGANISM="Detonula confervacea, Strain CCMP 353" /LENGTH=727 /DNA_ID=CAMNT_0013022059 /DNA_START=198 /DNA_END=2381 /DNA_ORIENTATION=+